MRSFDLRVVIVVMIVRAPPNAARAERQDTETFHEPFGDFGSRQDRVMLLIMINHEEPEKKKARKDAASDLQVEMRG